MTRVLDECPGCGGRMEEAWAECGDYDPDCDCDQAWDCPHCGRKWFAPCAAHINSYDTSVFDIPRELITDGR